MTFSDFVIRKVAFINRIVGKLDGVVLFEPCLNIRDYTRVIGRGYMECFSKIVAPEVAVF